MPTSVVVSPEIALSDWEARTESVTDGLLMQGSSSDSPAATRPARDPVGVIVTSSTVESGLSARVAGERNVSALTGILETDLGTDLRRRLAMANASEQSSGESHIPAESLRPAAVLVPLLVRDSGITMLFTRRSETLRNHAGQISFPGGRVEAGDGGPPETALREAREEIGLAPHHVQMLGRMPPYHSVSGYLIHPCVGLVECPGPLCANPAEVTEIFEVPLPFLLDPENHRQQEVEHRGRRRRIYAIPYRDYHIWGVTAAIIREFYNLLQDRR